MDNPMLILTIIFFAIVLICWIANLFVIKKRDRASIWLNRGLYITGMLAVICNFFRVLPMEMAYKGTMQAANGIAFVCILISYIRMELGKNTADAEYVNRKDDPEEKSDK